MTDPEIFQLVLEAHADALPDRPAARAALRVTSTLAQSDIDSLAMLEIAGYIEKRLGIIFPPDELARVDSVRTLIALIQKYTQRVERSCQR